MSRARRGFFLLALPSARAHRNPSSRASDTLVLQQRRRMHRSTHVSADDGSAAAAVAPLLKLRRAAEAALRLGRFVRVVELRERELAAAQAALPHDSLVVARLMDDVVGSRTTQHVNLEDTATVSGDAQAAFRAAWRDDARALPLARDALAIYHARWRAGTLLAPRAEERAYFACFKHAATPADLVGAELYKNAASHAMDMWPPLRARSPEDNARLQAVHGALQTVLALRARGQLERWPMRDDGEEAFALIPLQSLLWRVLHGGGTLLPRLRAECGLQREEEAALRALALHASVVPQGCLPPQPDSASSAAEAQEQERRRRSVEASKLFAAQDLARHGLRACTLPECGAKEPQPKAFKVCGRCRAHAYCCAAHQQRDWPRHKRDDECKQQQQA
jgi:hypothetical protein